MRATDEHNGLDRRFPLAKSPGLPDNPYEANVPEMPNMRMTSAEFQKRFESLADKALTEPLTITRNGRDQLVLLSVEEYDRLKRRDRRVVRLEDFTDEEMALIAQAEAPPEHAHLDAELKDWRP